MRNKKLLYKIPILFFVFCFLGLKSIAQSPADSLLNFIVKNKKRTSLCLSKNDTIIVKYNENKVMPLAGAVYIIVAVEFAKQAGSMVIDEDSSIALSDLDKYYIPEIDSASYIAWLNYENSRGHIHNDSIRLVNVARGMMMYNNNANAEYLIDLLGIDNVKSNIQLFGLTHHTAVFPFAASLFLYQNPKKIKDNQIVDGIKSLSEEQYCKIIYEMHKALKYDSILKPKFNAKDCSAKLQKLWSDRLPASTTKEYVQICKVLNNRKFINDNGYGVLAEILETTMEDSAKLRWLKHEGMKEGNTPWLLTKVLYGITKEGTRIEMAYFFNDLTQDENKKLKSWMDSFETSTLSNENFRQKIEKALD
jgi:D-alanyl-D-alanine carboxypeptidase